MYLAAALMLLDGCATRQNAPCTLKTSGPQTMRESEYFIVFLVDAPHFDYTSSRTLFRGLLKHPQTASKSGYVGHAWVYLQGSVDGRPFCVEGGHSGELGIFQPKYFDGIMNYIEYGYADPDAAQKKEPAREPNPIRYLYAVQRDGFFQSGSGGHTPTFAAKIDLDKECFEKVLAFIHPQNYPYADYCVMGRQCSTFLAQIGLLVDFPIEHTIDVDVEPRLRAGRFSLPLWSDPRYARLTLSTPDMIEKALLRAVAENRAEDALAWYLCRQRVAQTKNAKTDRTGLFKNIVNSFTSIPYRWNRFLLYINS